MTPKDKYKNVWIYRRLTDSLKQLMDEGEMSPTDVIESVRLACDMYFNDAVTVCKQHRENVMNCKDCGEQMEGNGYTTVFHCPNVDVSDITPDCDPVYCEAIGVDKTLLGDYKLLDDCRFRVGVTSFGLSKGKIVKVTQIDKEYSQVLVDFGGGYVDWFHETVLDKFEKM